jgi:hypothetical protein
MLNYLAAGKANFLLGIWVFRFIIKDLPEPNGRWLRNDYKLDYVAGKANYYPWEED